MDGADRGEIAVLERIVALLFALARLSDRLGARPGLLGLGLLWVLTRAERVARDYLTGTALEAGLVPYAVFVRTDIDRAGAAARLAQKFRVLALWLQHAIGQFCAASLVETASRPGRPAPSGTKRRSARLRRPAPIDTS